MQHSDVTGQTFDCPVTFTNTVDFSGSTGLTLPAAIVGQYVYLPLDVAALVASGGENVVNGGVFGMPSPVAGTIVKIQSYLKSAIATGNAIVTARIGATSVTNGAITIIQAGSAQGDIGVANPTAANTVAVGSNLNVIVTGTQDLAVGATLMFTIRRTA